MPRKTISIPPLDIQSDYHTHPDLIINGEAEVKPRTRVRKKKSAETKSANDSVSAPSAIKKVTRLETSNPDLGKDTLEGQDLDENSTNDLQVTFRSRKDSSKPRNVSTPLPVNHQNDEIAVQFRKRARTNKTEIIHSESETILQNVSSKISDESLLSEFDNPFILNWRPILKVNVPPSKSPARSKSALKQQVVTAEQKPMLELPEIDFGSEEFDISFQFRDPNKALKEDSTVLGEEIIEDIPSIEVAPKPEPRPIILAPEDAPQIIVHNLVPSIAINHKLIAPFGFALGPLNGKTFDVAIEEIALAYESGVELIQFEVALEFSEEGITKAISEYNLAVQKITETAPNVYLFIRLNLQPNRNWSSDYSDAKQIGSGLSQIPSLASDAYWNEACKFIEKFIEEITQIPSQKLIGIHLGKEPWLRNESSGYDYSIAAHQKFREWCKSRYVNDPVTLRAAWFDGQVSFETLEVPQFEPQQSQPTQFVRGSRKDRSHVDYHLFLSDLTVSRISDLAYSVKKASHGALLTAVTYGASLELAYPYSGQLSFGKLLRIPHLDIVCGSPSYRNRQPGGAASFPSPVDSAALNGKLFIFEEDYKTSLSGRVEDDDVNPVIRTPQALESVQWRGVGAALTHSAGIMWCDSYSLGWLKAPGIWRRASEVKRQFVQRMSLMPKDPDAIVFVDERALAYLVDPNAFTLMIQNVCEAALRSGLNLGFYLLSDLAHRERFPESKLYLFLNAWDIRTDIRSAIKNRLQKGNKVLFWLYAAALLDSGRESLERTREVMGIAIKPQPFHSKSGTSLVNKRHPLTMAFPDRGLIGGSNLEPSYFAIYDNSQDILGQYTQTGLSSFVVKQFPCQENSDDGWTSVFLGEPIVSPGLIRSLGQLANAHVYDFHEDTVHTAPPFFISHCRIGGSKTLPLPSNWSVYDSLGKSFMPIEANSHRRMSFDSSTQDYFIGPKEDIEALLNVNEQEASMVGDYPAQDLNTISGNGQELDVPLLRLADWIGVSESESTSEDWLLRPTVAEFESYEVNDSDSHPDLGPTAARRQRRERWRKTRKEKNEVPDVVDTDTGMSVMFRKRD